MLKNVMKFYELYVKLCPPRFVPWLRSWFPLHTPFLLLQCFPSIPLSSFVEFLVINPNQAKPSVPHICASTTKERCLYLILRKNFNVRCMGFYVHTYHSWAITWFFAQTFLQSYNPIYIFTRFQSSHITCIKKKMNNSCYFRQHVDITKENIFHRVFYIFHRIFIF